MRIRTKLVAGIVFIFLLMAILPAGAQDKLDKNSIKRIVMTAFPELKAQDIKINMIKKLNTRIKINLAIEERIAILYLKWQRHRNGARWWFETDAKRSLVYLGKASARSKAVATKQKTSDAKSETAATESKSRVETVKLDAKEGKEGNVNTAVTQKPKAEETVRPSQKKTEARQAVIDRKAEKKEPVKTTPKAEAGVKAEEKKPEKVEPKPEMVKVEPAKTEKEIPAEQQKNKAVTEPKQETPSKSKKEEPAKKEQTPVPEPKQEPAKSEEPEVTPVERDETVATEPETKTEPVADPTPEPAIEQKQPAMDTMAAAPKPKPTPFVTIEVATGPLGTPSEFLASLVVTIRQGEEAQYANYLFRPSEMANDIQERDFQRGVDSWVAQMADLHSQMQSVTNVSINKVILQRPQTEELENITLTNLRNRIKSVDKVYTYVKINMVLDGAPAYISIGGLIHTINGWRIGGRLELVRQMSIQ